MARKKLTDEEKQARLAALDKAHDIEFNAFSEKEWQHKFPTIFDAAVTMPGGAPLFMKCQWIKLSMESGDAKDLKGMMDTWHKINPKGTDEDGQELEGILSGKGGGTDKGRIRQTIETLEEALR